MLTQTIPKYISAIVSIGIALMSIYSAGFGQFPPTFHRSLIVLAGAIVILASYPLANHLHDRLAFLRPYAWLMDLALGCVITYAAYNFVNKTIEVENGFVVLSTFDVWVAFTAILGLIDLIRRVFGPPVALVSVLGLVYILFGNYFPGFFEHRGFSLEATMTTLWYSFLGIFGLPTAIMLNFVLVYIVFGTILEGTGAGRHLIKVVLYFVGGNRGGPAHAAIVASGVFGTMSGSVTANVVGTGTFTIPMIKERGFPGHFAGAVEAAASAGGQIMPPVMAAAAFLMAELTGVPYLSIIVAALLPALFYYAAIFFSVSLEAASRGVEPLPKSERPVMTAKDWWLTIQFVGPILTIAVLLVLGRSPALAGFWAIIVTVALAFLNPEFRRRPQRLITSLINGGRNSAALLVTAAALGVIIGTMDKSGLGISFANEVLAFSESNLYLALFMTMAACILLGMGMPTLPAYLVIVLVMGPAIEKLGVPVIALHMFVLYYAVLSNLTPPVAIAAYAAAPIADANPMAIGVTAVRLAIVGFIAPFVFIEHPVLLLNVVPFDLAEFAWVILSLSVSIYLLTTALAGIDRERLTLFSRIARLVCVSLTLFAPLAVLNWIGLMIGLILIGWRRLPQIAKSENQRTNL